jgi:hypothetical protein
MSIYKENSGYAAKTNGGDPSTWGPRKMWEGNGPAGADAIDIASQDDSEFEIWGASFMVVSFQREISFPDRQRAAGHMGNDQLGISPLDQNADQQEAPAGPLPLPDQRLYNLQCAAHHLPALGTGDG